MAPDAKKGTEEEESGEFAEFMADISEEIAQRVASLEPPPTSSAEKKKPTPIPPDPGVIVDWENVADRMIEEVR
jgi:hypothetical protein